MSGSKFNLGQLALTAVIGIVSGAVSAIIATDSLLKEQPQIKVVDIKKITSAQILQIEEKFKQSGVVNPETVELFGQKAASDMFKAIEAVGGADFILTKGQVIRSPSEAEITSEIGTRLGLDLEEKSLNDAIKAFDSVGGQ